jgi:hypothetical protein
VRRRALRYADEAAAIADVERLQAGCTAVGHWTLAQACYHCAWPMNLPLTQATSQQSDEQKPYRQFLDEVNAAGVWPDQSFPSPPKMDPPADAGASSIDDYVGGLRRIADCNWPVLENKAFGPTPLADYRRFTLIHAAHHFSFFHPTA